MARLNYYYSLDMTRDFLDASSYRKANSFVTDSPFQGGDSISQEYRVTNPTTGSISSINYGMTGELKFDKGRVVDGLIASINLQQYPFFTPQGQQQDFNSNRGVFLSDIYKPYYAELASGVVKSSVYEWALSGDDAIGTAGTYTGGVSGLVVDDKLFAFTGNDWIFAASGNDYIDGGPGLDTSSYLGKISEYTINKGDGFISIGDLVANRDGLDTLVNIERLQFADYTLDVSKNAPIDKSIYLLYKAAFGRLPDLDGFSYWSAMAAEKNYTANDLAAMFSQSTEFKTIFGDNPTNQQYVNKLYQNILDRVPDITGSAFWVDQLSKNVPRETVLVGFALSDENLKGTEKYTKDGYWLL